MAPSWVITIFVPTLATIINNIMWLAPLLAILETRKKGDLGNLNPVPFAMIVLNCIGWVLYAVMIKNYFIFMSNFTGTILGLFFVMSALQLLVKPEPCEKEKRMRFQMEAIVLVGLTLWLFTILVTNLVYDGDNSKSISFVGGLADTLSLMYFAAPLSTIVEVIKTGDASSLYFPSIFANFANATLWFFYGLLGIYDVNVWIPNGVAMLLTLSQIFIIFYYRNSSGKAHSDGERTDSHENPMKQYSFEKKVSSNSLDKSLV